MYFTFCFLLSFIPSPFSFPFCPPVCFSPLPSILHCKFSLYQQHQYYFVKHNVSIHFPPAKVQYG